ncbi:MAG: hypothetical protein Q8J68_12875 [Methanolobus sp.]|uniref:hypothetical protein n=1 Tax=Methanolobus sp. TaxID=1874737 RepID=UPI002730AEF2|nr:hypothetical protein [Methanolobus sp.]MDP2218167.1 hypothetical protein [Methanolobus sp.]
MADGTAVATIAPAADYEFTADSTIYLYNDTSNATLKVGLNSHVEAVDAAKLEVVAAVTETVNVKIIDVASQQMIADMNVRF